MKYYKILLTLIVTVITTSFVACSDDNPEFSKKYLPVKIVSEGEISTTVINYSYDNNNRLTKAVKTETYTIDNSQNEISLEIDYNNLNKVSRLMKTVKEESADQKTDTIDFTYSGTNIRADNYIATVNTEGQLLTLHKFEGNENNIKTTRFCEYDSLGNLSKSTFIEFDNPSRHISTYEYDQLNGIFKDVNIPKWFLIACLDENFNLENNSTQQTIVSADGEDFVTTRLYEYNMDGYPVSEYVYHDGYSLTVNIHPITIEYKIQREQA